MSFIEEGLNANSTGEQSRKKKRKSEMRDSDGEVGENNRDIGEIPLENSKAQATTTKKKSNIKKRKKKFLEGRISDEKEAANVQELSPEDDDDDGMIEVDENKKGSEEAVERDEAGTDHVDSREDPGSDFKDDKFRKKNKKKRKKFLDEANIEEEDANAMVQELGQEGTDGGKVEEDEEKRSLQWNDKHDKEPDTNSKDSQGDPDTKFSNKAKKQNKRKQLLVKEAAEAGKRGVCYLSRIPPHMDHVKLRHILSQYGEVKRIYLAPEDPAAQVKCRQAGGFRGKEFSEGWVEFAKKSVAKRVADMLNGEQIGGRKRTSYYYDLWNIKYLSKFKWDDLTQEIAHKIATREQKLYLEVAAAKRERDFYLAKVDQSRALTSIEDRLKKKQNRLEDSATKPGNSPVSQASKVIRVFPQKQPVANDAAQAKPRLSKEMLAGVFGAS